MSLKISELVWKHSKHKGSTRLVLLAIARYAKDDGTGAWPSLPTLKQDTGLSIRSVQYALHELRESGELLTEEGAGPKGCNLYTILIGRSRKDCVSAKIAPTQETTGSNAKNDAQVTQPVAPDPSVKPSKIRQKEKERAREVQPQLFRPVPKSESARAPTQISNSRAPTRPHTLPYGFLEGTGLREWATREAKTHDAALNTDLLARKFVNYYSAGGRGASERLTDEEWEAKWRQWALDEIDNLLQKGRTQTKAQGSTNGQDKPSKLAGATRRVHRELYGTDLDEVYSHTNGRADADYQASSIPQLPQPPKAG